MNYMEYISSLDAESLKLLSENYNIDYITQTNWAGDEAKTLQPYLVDVFTNITNLSNNIQLLDNDSKNLMKIIYFSDEPCDQDDIIRKFNNLYGKDNNVRACLDLLWKKGLIIKFEMFYKNRPYLGLVDETKPIIARMISDELCSNASDTNVDVSISTTPYELSQDIYVFLSYVNNNETKLTIKNQIFKKAAHKVENTFIGTSNYLDDTLSEYTERFNFINNFLYMVNLITYDNYTVYLNKEKVNKWLSFKLSKKMEVVNDFFKNFYVGSKREITEAIDKINMVILNYIDAPIKLSSFVAIIKKYSSDMNFSYIQSNVNKIINYFVLIGMANFYKDVDDNLYFKLNKYGEKFYSGDISAIDEDEEFSFYIQPNFEIISTINLSPKLRWELDSFAELKKLDKTLHYVLTKNSIFKALSTGKNLDDILKLLKDNSKTGMPQNIEYTIKEWATGYGSVYMTDTILLRSVSENLTKELCSIPEISCHILEILTDKILVVDKNHADEILDIIVKKGYMANPNIIVSTNDTSTKIDSLDDLISDILGSTTSSRSDVSFGVDPQYLDKNEHFKKTVMNIKPMSKDERERNIALKIFSPSVFQARDIIQNAIEQSKPILVDYLEPISEKTSKMKISPLEINRDEDSWFVKGYDKVLDKDVSININNIQSIEFSNN